MRNNVDDENYDMFYRPSAVNMKTLLSELVYIYN